MDSTASFSKYLTGFILSVIFTITAYVIVVQHVFPAHILLISIILLAAIQFGVQMFFFLHLGGGAGSRDRLVLLGFAALIVTIIVSGSLWIMTNLNSRMMPTEQQMELYMNSQIGI